MFSARTRHPQWVSSLREVLALVKLELVPQILLGLNRTVSHFLGREEFELARFTCREVGSFIDVSENREATVWHGSTILSQAGGS